MAEMAHVRSPEVAPTRLLYHTDSYLKQFLARVVAVSGNAFALDQTAFFPGGGGQIADRGELILDGPNGRRLPVSGMRKEGGLSGTRWPPRAGSCLPSARRSLASSTGRFATA